MTTTTSTTTWDDVGALARAVAELTGPANLSHDLLLELAGPIVDRMAAAVAELRQDPHGDSDETEAESGPRKWGPAGSEAWAIRTGKELFEQLTRINAEQPLPEDDMYMLGLVATLDAGPFSWTNSAKHELTCGRTGRVLTRKPWGWELGGFELRTVGDLAEVLA